MTLTLNVGVNVTPRPQARTLQLIAAVTVTPQQIVSINISTPILNAAFAFVDDILENYIDEDRELKTLINFGSDRQNVIIGQRYGNPDLAGFNTLQVKLLQPLQPGLTVGDTAFINREINKSVIDKVKTQFAPQADTTPYLRPKNVLVNTKNTIGAALNNVTLNVLNLRSGSVGEYTPANNYTFEDSVYRQLYTFDFNSADVNIDFSNYENFVFYGSAAMRLAAFRLKLLKLEELEQKRIQFSGTLFTGSLASAGASYVLEQSQKYAREKETIIRQFDKYEQYLYFTPSGSNSPYSASFIYADTGTEYNSLAYWPKDANNQIISPSNVIADNWYADQLAIAQRFDEFNENNLVNTIPSHIREDEDSGAYITFVTMIGHFFDLIKPYIDQFPYIYDRYINPNEKLSKDLITNIAESVGFTLPSFNTTKNLQPFFTDSQPEADAVNEIQKRVLHNLSYFTKAKGSRSALVALLRSAGIPESILTVKETGPAIPNSYYVFNEFSTGLYMTGSINQHIILPLSASNRTPLPRSIQLNLAVDVAKDMTVLTGDDKWALHIKKHPTNSSLGRFELTSGSSATIILSSSYEQIFTDELISLSLRTYDTGSYATLFVAQTYGEDLIFSSSMSETIGAGVFEPLWSTTDNLYLGGSGSLMVDNFDGTFDEVRYWGINLSDEMTLVGAFDPASNAGDDYTQPVNYLYGQLSFNKIYTASLPTWITNESPYYDIDGSPSLTIFESTGFTTESFVRYNRTVRQVLPNANFTTYLTTKIKVAPPPVFNSTNGIKELSRTRSIVSVDQKNRNTRFGNNKVIVATSPTEIINQNIMRSLGIQNINLLLGSPTDTSDIFEKGYTQLKKYYEQYYYVNVDFNKYIRILSKLNSVLTDVIQYFIPSRATLYNGVVIEPSILDRTKISLLKKMRVYGAGTRKTEAAPSSLTGSKPDYQATFNLAKNIELIPYSAITGKYSTYTSSLQIAPDTLLSTYNVYDRQHLSYTLFALASASKAPVKASSIKLDNALTGSYNNYRGQINDELVTLTGSYTDYGIQHRGYAITQSNKPASIVVVTEPEAKYTAYDLQALNYVEYAAISQSYVPGTFEYTASHHTPWPRAKLDTQVSTLNKFKFNSLNLGSPGAEPYNRVYTRKLFEYEVLADRVGGTSSLNVDALYDIKPSCNFDELGSYTYFNHPHGIYYYPVTKYNPTYYNPLNQEWNFDSQSFASVSNWFVGSRHVYNDVVYQNLTTTELNQLNLPEELLKRVRAGNKKYYVFKTRPAYRAPSDGTAWNFESVPTYLPPALDRENWSRLQFVPTTRFEPRRVIFETFTVTDPSLNNYKTTTVSVDRVLDTPGRYVNISQAGNISPNGQVFGEIIAQNISTLFALQASNANLRVRLYRTSAARIADVNRNIYTMPSPSAGVLLDKIAYAANVPLLVNPVVTLVAGSTPAQGKIFYTLDNLDATTKTSTSLILYYFAIQIEPSIPVGYLRKHYRFFRDTSTATLRRNYIGCKNTEETTIDGLPPVQVFVGEGTQLNTLPTSVSNEIIIGGGGTLNVT